MESAQETGFLFRVSYPAVKMGPEALGPTGFPKSIKDKARETLGSVGCWSQEGCLGETRLPNPLNRAGFLDVLLEESCSGIGDVAQ